MSAVEDQLRTKDGKIYELQEVGYDLQADTGRYLTKENEPKTKKEIYIIWCLVYYVLNILPLSGTVS